MQNATVPPIFSQKALGPAPLLSTWPPLPFILPGPEIPDPGVSPVCPHRTYGSDFFLAPKFPPGVEKELERR